MRDIETTGDGIKRIVIALRGEVSRRVALVASAAYRRIDNPREEGFLENVATAELQTANILHRTATQGGEGDAAVVATLKRAGEAIDGGRIIQSSPKLLKCE